MSGFTDGPWVWDARQGSYMLRTPDRGQLTVMDFVRKGMQRAEPRFAVMVDDQPRGRRGGIMHSATEIAGKGTLQHPDALLIAAAPDLFDAARAAVAYDEAIRSCANDPDKMSSYCSAEGDDLDALYLAWMTASRAAIARAEGKS